MRRPETRREVSHAGWMLAAALLLPTPPVLAAAPKDCARLDLEAEFFGVPTPGGFTCVVAGDWNEDGLPDLATVDIGSMVTTILGRGGFHLALGHEFALDIAPRWMAVRDMDGDGHQDLAVTGTAGTVILAGDGKGSFREVERFPEPGEFVAAGDLDGDGRPDIVLARSNAPVTLIYRGSGDVRELAPSTGSVALADLDHDGDLDLAATDASGHVNVWLNDGHGTFAAPVAYPVGLYPGLFYITTGDANGDGNPDIYAAGADSPSDINVYRLLGHGDGTFEVAIGAQPAPTRPSPGPSEPESRDARMPTLRPTAAPTKPAHVRRGPRFIVVADFDGDGRDDVVTIGVERGFELGHQQDSSYLYFSEQRSVGGAVTGIAVDMDGDGKLDVVVAGANGIAVHPGLGDRSFRKNPTAATHSPPAGLKLADLDGDGRRDAVMTSVDDQLVVALTAPDGGFKRVIQDYDIRPTYGLAEFADFDGDGRVDLLGQNGIFFGNGDGTFRHTPLPAPFGAPGDFDEDGRVDIAAPDGDRIHMMLGNGDGTFRAGGDLMAQAREIRALDVDHDGHLDLVASGDTDLVVLYGRGDGTVAGSTRVPTIGWRMYPGSVWGDLNRDGSLDVITTDALGPSVFLSHGRDFIRSAFPGICCEFGAFAVDSQVGDLDGDGNADFMSAGRVWFGHGDGTFEGGEELYGPDGITVLEDRDGDGLCDVLVLGSYDSDHYQNTSTLILNRTVRNQPPNTAGARATIGGAWPPNGRFEDVVITGVTDPDGDPVTIKCLGVTQDEPVTGGPGARGATTKRADECADAVIGADGGAMVRFARNGSGNGRVYEITFSAADPCGATRLGQVEVDVPHDRGKACVDDGQRYNSLACGATPAEAVASGSDAPLAVERSPEGGLAIRYTLEDAAEVALEVFDLAGRRIARLDSGVREAGVHRSTWAPSVRNGVFFVRLTTNGQRRVMRYVALR